MGHLMIEEFDKTPDHIRKFAYEKIKNKINHAKDNKKLGCMFYILRAGLADSHMYLSNGVSITLKYSKLDKFDASSMIYL